MVEAHEKINTARIHSFTLFLSSLSCLSSPPSPQVVEGMDLVHRIEGLPKDGKDRPLEPVVIEGCGELKE